MRKITKIIVHCTATKEGQEVTANDVRKWHIARGFDTIGYHYLIDINGILWTGRPEEVVGAHCEGHNIDSIGICYVGGLDASGKPKDTRTADQKETMLSILKYLKKNYPNATICGQSQRADSKGRILPLSRPTSYGLASRRAVRPMALCWTRLWVPARPQSFPANSAETMWG